MSAAYSEAVAGHPLFRELCESVAKETHNFTFACGGSIPIVPKLPDSTPHAAPVVQETNTSADEPGEPKRWVHKHSPEWDGPTVDPAANDFDQPPTRSTLSLPVDLRWDPLDDTSPSKQTKISFPFTSDTEANLDKLVRDCEAATFGRGAEDVYDESYRKATKMDPSRFSSTFNPYEVGVVDTIAQILLPTLRHSQQTRTVKAELYKMNFYSAPSGKFKAHVDTPRSPDQFGSLVVCLPLSHKGGALEVRHQDRTVAFDWGTASSDLEKPLIKWAAFYSDCEHEVLEVTEGHRLTLTYNLYVVRGNGFLGGYSPALDPATFPLYKTINSLVEDASLWKDDGYIGYYCSHIYPHTSNTKLQFMVPDNLKGADMAMYSMFCSLGLGVSFRSAVDWSEMDYSPYNSDTEEFGNDSRIIKPAVLGADGKLGWVKWYGMEDGPALECDKWSGKRVRKGDESYEFERVPSYLRYKDVHWVNEVGHTECQASWIAYGNEPNIGFMYSSLVMVVEIPSRSTT